MGECERCGQTPEEEMGLLDYCAECSKNLCPGCMADGCCGNCPARSGTNEDNSDDDVSL